MYEKYFFNLMNMTKQHIISEGIVWEIWTCVEQNSLKKLKKEKLAKILARKLSEKF